MATGVRPVTAGDASFPRAWFRIAVGALAIVASVSAQAIDLTPLAIVLLVVAIVTFAPLALPAVDK